MTCRRLRRVFGVLSVLVIFAFAGLFGLTGSPVLNVTTAEAQTAGNVPGNWSGSLSDAEVWRAVRKGIKGRVSIPDKNAAQLVQSDGDSWRAVKNGPVSQFGGWLLLAMIVLLGLFYAFRGRIMIDGGPSGQTIERFNSLERMVHWLTATSFIVLALTGLNLLYGRYILMPILGQDLFAALTYYGKISHNYIAFSFMVGVVLMLVLWIKDNFPNQHDLKWIAQAGGLFTKGSHPPSKRFNAGQKFIFWWVVLAGISMSLSGLTLMFPFMLEPMAKFATMINLTGIGAGGELSQLQQTQVASIWHALVGLVFIAVIIGHIYIGSVGMEGAIEAVSTGQVDRTWAKNHHNLWVEEVDAEGAEQAEAQPAE